MPERIKKIIVSLVTIISIVSCCLVTYAEDQQTVNTGETYEDTSEESAATTTEAVTETTETEGNTDTTKDQSQTSTPNLDLTCRAAILMEASTGTVIYQQNSEEQLRPASITKIMTLILIFDALKEGRLKLDDMVTTSAYAKSMGGSQVFLEEGEQQTVETMIKCIIIASGNDASVAMAEHLCGSEAEFVNQMNERAKGLGMTATHFEDCCGLTDSATHVTSAKDVAIMSRELITKYPEVLSYSSIWMDKITHVTSQGTTEFGLANTNKLLKQYQYTTGLKTGSTSLAKYCVSATASKDGVNLIAVIMAAPDYKARFSEAITLFNYGFSNCKLYQDMNEQKVNPVKVKEGVKELGKCEYAGPFSYVSTTGENLDSITKEVIIDKKLKAPIKKGDVAGKVVYKLGDKEIGEINIVFTESIKKAGFADYLKKAVRNLLM